MDDEARRQARAQQRRQGYPGEIVVAGTPKPALYDALTLLQRLACMTALSQRLARLSGTAQSQRPRAEWPGEVFRIERP